MATKNPTQTDGQVPTKPHDAGSQANETLDGLGPIWRRKSDWKKKCGVRATALRRH
jgi:hypothetical protein